MKKDASRKNGPSAPITDHWRSMAEKRCAAAGARLTPARLAAYAELIEGQRALTAYELIDRLEQRQERKIAPLTVYRHLDFLTGVGLVHRIESTQSYLPCDHPQHPHESQYLLCSECGHVDEVHSDPLEEILEGIARKRGFRPSRAVVEVSGLCEDCAAH